MQPYWRPSLKQNEIQISLSPAFEDEFLSETARWSDLQRVYGRWRPFRWYDYLNATGSPLIPKLILELSPAGIYVGKKVVDVLVARIMSWYLKKDECEHRRVEL